MKPIEKRFFTLLEKKATAPVDIDDTDISTQGLDPDAETEALGSMMDDPKTIDKLKTSLSSKTNVVDDTDAKMQAETVTMKEKLIEWVEVLEAFSEFLNGNDQHSMNHMLSAAVPDSLFNKIKASTGKRLSRVAVDVSGLREELKSYIVGNP